MDDELYNPHFGAAESKLARHQDTALVHALLAVAFEVREFKHAYMLVNGVDYL